MKKLFLILFLFPFLGNSVSAQNTKAEKAAKLEEAFQQTLTLVESNQFQFELDRVYSQGGYDLSRFNPSGKITITDSLAKGNLPFFGRAYSLPYGDGGGIEFDGRMREQKTQIENRKRKKSILYRFTITGNNDTYQIAFEIAPGGNCSMNLNSNNRAQISYSGKITPIEEDNDK